VPTLLAIPQPAYLKFGPTTKYIISRIIYAWPTGSARATEDVDDQDNEAQAVEKDAFEELKKLATAYLNEKPSEVILFSFFYLLLVL
jgi:hypothetical protein